jgi:hypothetical protein
MRKMFAAVTLALLLIPRWAAAGPLAVWGVDPFAHTSTPGDFVALAAGGALQTLAIRANGTLCLSSDGDPTADFIPPVADQNSAFLAVGMGRNHALAIRPDGSILAWGKQPITAAVSDTPIVGQFVAVAGGSNHSVALDINGNVVVWGSSGTPAPTGIRFIAIAARLSYTLALSADGDIYGWGTDPRIFGSATHPWTKYDESGHFVAPREAGTSYTAISAGVGPNAPLGLIVALRADGSVAMWDPSGLIPDAPAGVVFTQIAAGLGYWVGIDQAGQLHARGDSNHTTFTSVPAGVYSGVSAATGHATAISGPFSLLTAAGPASVWLGLKNSDDVGTKFDLRAEVLRNGDVVGAGQLDSVAGGSSGFNNAVLRTINIALPSTVNMSPGGALSVRLSVRIAAGVSGHRSGTARLWFNDAAATSRLSATLNGSQDDYYLVGSPQARMLQKNVVGPGPKNWIDVFVDRAVGGNPFKPFGAWSIVVQ